MAHNRLNMRRVITSALLADADIAAIVGDKVRGPDALDYETGTAEFPCLIVTMQSSGGLYEGTYEEAFVLLQAYSRSGLGEAVQIIDLARDVLHAQKLTISGITERVVCTEINGPSDGYDQDFNASTCDAVYRAQMTG